MCSMLILHVSDRMRLRYGPDRAVNVYGIGCTAVIAHWETMIVIAHRQPKTQWSLKVVVIKKTTDFRDNGIKPNEHFKHIAGFSSSSSSFRPDHFGEINKIWRYFK